MKKINGKKLSLTAQTIKALDAAALRVGGAATATSAQQLGDSCYYNQCRLTDAASLAAGGMLKTCWCY